MVAMLLANHRQVSHFMLAISRRLRKMERCWRYQQWANLIVNADAQDDAFTKKLNLHASSEQNSALSGRE